MTIRYRAGDLRTFAYNLLYKKGMQSDLAGTVANVLLEGNLLGHTTHGLQLLEPYLNEFCTRMSQFPLNKAPRHKRMGYLEDHYK